MKPQIAESRPPFSPSDPVGQDVGNYVSAMVAKQAHKPDPIMGALRSLGVTVTTMGNVTGMSKGYFTHIAAGRKPMPESIRPVLVELLAQSVSAARSAISGAMDDPRYPAEAIEFYMRKITEAEKVLQKNST